MTLHTEEAAGMLERLKENCTLLGAGWQEPVEYAVPVTYHRAECPRSRVTCECPQVTEKRTRYVKRPGLLEQLKEFQANKDVDRNAKAARGAPRVKTPKMHPELAGFFVLDEICTDIYMTVDRALEECDRDRAWASMATQHVLAGLTTQVSYFVESRPDVARTVVKATDKWVAQARRALKISVDDSMFESTVCANCGGGLSTRHDHAGDLREIVCVGTPSDPPCGETYPMSEWLKIYEGRQ